VREESEVKQLINVNTSVINKTLSELDNSHNELVDQTAYWSFFN
jgi:hypothetical protein